ncbi:hypothetical protein EV284_6408 [Streptomyces sp. BK022]|uniref:hypothetical protein n=1 Tax=Streptomyces sp. BK022 TaxID=2512123 RepID=UPI001029C04C|nr:hypothetical protein [Streptomyces sp. BK022]RZU28242.1 hypothetical protein EV284_6408 [Streptomyces sp. BK022]
MPLNKATVSAFDDALAKLATAARALIPMIAETLHAQFPTGAYLVLTRSKDPGHADDVLFLNSVRDASGGIVCWLDPSGGALDPLPAVPPEIAARWGDSDPRSQRDLLDLLQAVDAVDRYTFFDWLPDEARRPGESDYREPIGVPLPCQCRVSGECAPC